MFPVDPASTDPNPSAASAIEPFPGIVPARSRRDALDLALVLASQSIPATIQQNPDDQTWLLEVAPPDLSNARDTIQLYRQENRFRTRLPQPLGPEAQLHFAALPFWTIIGLIHQLDAWQDGRLRTAGTMTAQALAPHSPEPWRLLTAVTLHADIGHLAMNATLGFLFLGMVMGSLGPGLALLAALATGVAGNLAGGLIHPTPFIGLGASGLVMGSFGLLLGQSIAHSRTRSPSPVHTPNPILLRRSLAGLFLFLILGSSEHSDLVAHLAGFLSGVFIGLGLAHLPTWTNIRRRGLDAAMGITAILTLALAWTRALR